MTDEEKDAVAWFESLSDEDLKTLILKSYRDYKNEREALGFKWGD